MSIFDYMPKPKPDKAKKEKKPFTGQRRFSRATRILRAAGLSNQDALEKLALAELKRRFGGEPGEDAPASVRRDYQLRKKRILGNRPKADPPDTRPAKT